MKIQKKRQGKCIKDKKIRQSHNFELINFFISIYLKSD